MIFKGYAFLHFYFFLLATLAKKRRYAAAYLTDILSQNVFARTSFAASDIILNQRFEDITSSDENDMLSIYISKMNKYISNA